MNLRNILTLWALSAGVGSAGWMSFIFLTMVKAPNIPVYQWEPTWWILWPEFIFLITGWFLGMLYLAPMVAKLFYPVKDKEVN